MRCKRNHYEDDTLDAEISYHFSDSELLSYRKDFQVNYFHNIFIQTQVDFSSSVSLICTCMSTMTDIFLEISHHFK